MPPLEWMRALRDGVDLSKSTKAVAFCLALHAKPDGTSAHPGWKRLAWESGTSKRTVIAALRELEGLGLLYCVERGSNLGQRDRASNYSLTVHDVLEDITTPYSRWLEMNGLKGAEVIQMPSRSVAREQPGADPWASAW